MLGDARAHAGQDGAVWLALQGHVLAFSSPGRGRRWKSRAPIYGFSPGPSRIPGGRRLLDGGMETMHEAAPARPRWFAGLRRPRSRMLGGVASGLADYWLLDPMLLRVLLVSPIATGILALMLLPWSEAVLGAWLAVGITQMSGARRPGSGRLCGGVDPHPAGRPRQCRASIPRVGRGPRARCSSSSP